MGVRAELLVPPNGLHHLQAQTPLLFWPLLSKTEHESTQRFHELSGHSESPLNVGEPSLIDSRL